MSYEIDFNLLDDLIWGTLVLTVSFGKVESLLGGWGNWTPLKLRHSIWEDSFVEWPSLAMIFWSMYSLRLLVLISCLNITVSFFSSARNVALVLLTRVLDRYVEWLLRVSSLTCLVRQTIPFIIVPVFLFKCLSLWRLLILVSTSTSRSDMPSMIKMIFEILSTMSYSFVALDDGFWFGFAFFSGVLKALNDEGITLLALLEDFDFMLRGIFVMMIMYNSNGELKNTEYFVIVNEIFICIK